MQGVGSAILFSTQQPAIDSNDLEKTMAKRSLNFVPHPGGASRLASRAFGPGRDPFPVRHDMGATMVFPGYGEADWPVRRPRRQTPSRARAATRRTHEAFPCGSVSVRDITQPAKERSSSYEGGEYVRVLFPCTRGKGLKRPQLLNASGASFRFR